MPGEKLTPVGRLAFRVEGANWNCYYTMPDTMEGGLFFGSIRMAFVEKSPEIKQAFMQLMRNCFDVIGEDLFGQRASWLEPTPAPEHERSKE